MTEREGEREVERRAEKASSDVRLTGYTHWWGDMLVDAECVWDYHQFSSGSAGLAHVTSTWCHVRVLIYPCIITGVNGPQGVY